LEKVWFGLVQSGLVALVSVGEPVVAPSIPVSGLMGLSRPVFHRSGGGKVAEPRLPLWRAGMAALFPGVAQKKT
jgi:hypothetical protein